MQFSIYACAGLIQTFLYTRKAYKKIYMNIFLAISICFLMYNIFLSVKYQKEHIESSNLNVDVISKICEYVKQYEQNTGITVSSVEFIHDARYDFDFWLNNLNTGTYPVLYAEWSRIHVLNIYLEKNLKEEEIINDENDELHRYFEENDWHELNIEEQVKFQGDTMYLCGF